MTERPPRPRLRLERGPSGKRRWMRQPGTPAAKPAPASPAAAFTEDARAVTAVNCARVAEQGGWPPHIRPDSLLARLPHPNGDGTWEPGLGGFDAGVACALDLIPRDRQELASRLHAAYTPNAISQVRREAPDMHPDSETTWWLAACSVCDEQPATPDRLHDQIVAFRHLVADPEARVAAARAQHQDMLAAYAIDPDLGFPVAVRDGGMQGAYLDGHPAAAMYADTHGIWFVGTPHDTLGLPDDFPWEQPGDPDAPTPADRAGKSGPVHGSRQFVKCASADELRRVLAAVSPSQPAG